MGVFTLARQAVGRFIIGGEKPQQPQEPIPSWAAQASYDGVQTNTDNTNYWSAADLLSADDANSPTVRRTARSRARYEMESDPSAYGMVATIANDLIGTEIRLQILDTEEADAQFVEREYADWMYAVEFFQKLRTCRIAKAICGESVILLTHNPQLGTPVELDFRPVECDRLADPLMSMNGDPNNIDGVILDVYGNPTEYYILHEYPGTLRMSGSGQEHTVFPRNSVIHWFRATRPEQHRGISELTPALPLFSLRRQYLISVVDASINAAQQSLVYHTNSTAEVEPQKAIGTAAPWNFFRNQATIVPYGYVQSQLKAEQPTGTFESFDDHLLREIARCLLLPRNTATGDSSDYNYASGRLDKQTYWRAIEIERSELKRKLLDRVFMRWLSEAVLIEGYLPESFRALDFELRHRWFFDGMLHVDPEKEAKAQILLVNAKLLPMSEVYASRGEYYLDGFDEIKKVDKAAADRGISIYGDDEPPTQTGTDDEEPLPGGEQVEQEIQNK